MVRKTLTFGALLIAFFEIVGFYVVKRYLDDLRIPAHLTQIPLFELPNYALAVFFRSQVVGVVASVLLFVLWIAYLVESGSAPFRTIAVQNPEKQLSFFSYTLEMIALDGSAGFMRTIRTVIIILLGFLTLASLVEAEDTAGLQVTSDLHGQVFNALPGSGARASVYIQMKRGFELPPGLRLPNARGALFPLWEDDKTIYVATINRKAPSPTWSIWVAIERDTIAFIKSTEEWKSISPKRAQEDDRFSDVTLICALAFLLIFLPVAFVISWTKQRALSYAIREASIRDLENLLLPEVQAKAIMWAARCGQDILLTARHSTERYIWIRNSEIKGGMSLSLKPATETVPAVELMTT